MSGQGLNLARRPFVNRRPVRRLALLLWLVGGGLMVANALLYWRYFSGQGERGARLEQLDRGIREEREAIARLERELAAIDLDWQNGQVEFLNEKIEQRVFSWSTLFDDVAAVLPDDVQLTRVAPRRARKPTRRATRSSRFRAAARADGAVELSLVGGAKDGEALLAFVDTLFEHPRFRNPDLSREARVDDGSIGFTLRVHYLPAPAPAALPVETPAAEGVTEEPAAVGEAAG